MLNAITTDNHEQIVKTVVKSLPMIFTRKGEVRRKGRATKEVIHYSMQVMKEIEKHAGVISLTVVVNEYVSINLSHEIIPVLIKEQIILIMLMKGWKIEINTVI